MKKGEFAVYGVHGLCQVNDIQVPGFLERGKEKLYYLMTSAIDAKGVLYVPVEGAEDKMRDAIDAQEAESLLADVSDDEVMEIPAGKKSEAVISSVIKRNETDEMMLLIKSLYRIKAERERAGKKFASMDERYLASAEKLLYSELAFALQTDMEDIRSRVRSAIAKRYAQA